MNMKKIKVWKIVIILIVCVIALFTFFTIRKINILNNLEGKISKFEKNTNIYLKTDSEKSTIEKFIIDDNSKTIIKYKDKPIIMIQVKNANEYENYTFYEQIKKVSVNNDYVKTSKVENYVETNSFFDKINKSINSKIYTENIDEKEYYVIDSKQNNNYLMLQDVESIKVYIDKETGLPLKLVEMTKESEHIVNYEYKTNVVTEDKITETDTSRYEMN